MPEFLCTYLTEDPIGTAEVYVIEHSDHVHFICSCLSYREDHTCDHVAEVAGQVEAHDGLFPVSFPGIDIPDEVIGALAQLSPDQRRLFNIQHAKIRVLNEVG